VARQVLEHRTPLERVAVLVPAADPLEGMLATRLARLPWPGGPLPVHVAGGLPATERAGGARVLALLRALAGFLPAERLAPLLPALRAEREGSGHLSHGEAAELAWSLGTVGGNAAAGPALEWSPRASARQAEPGGGARGAGARPVAEARGPPARGALAALARRGRRSTPWWRWPGWSSRSGRSPSSRRRSSGSSRAGSSTRARGLRCARSSAARSRR
jgi:hypothetical protein